ncbi:MAG: M15 family metallopeptidase [Actinomadura sp.]
MVNAVSAVVLGSAVFACGAPPAGTAAPADSPPRSRAAAGVEDGVVPDGRRLSPLSPHDAGLPAIAKLDPKLLHAVRRAARDAAGDGVDIFVTTGWRSRAYQQRLFDAAVVRYGSERDARRTVSTPEESHHVTGDAVDIGPTDADSWLSQHGSEYGLCQTYANEMWHFELATTPGGVCPEMHADASNG